GLASCSGPSAPEVARGAAVAAVSGPQEPAGDATAKRMRLMTAEQYRNTLSYVFGPGISMPTSFAPVTRMDGLLSVGTSFAGVTAAQMEIYQKTAATAASQVVDEDNRNFLVPCTPKSAEAADDACARQFLGAVGRLVYRRPMPKERLDEYVKEAGASAARLKDFYTGLGTALEGMLLSPRVLMVSERVETAKDGTQRLDSYALASRLSFFLWNAAPDDLLLKAAETGDLTTQKGLAKQLDRMLASPRLEAGMRAFFDDMFHFEDFNNLAKDSAIYPVFTGVAVQDAREQTLRTVMDQLLVKNADYRDLFTTRATFISPSLAAIYKLPTTPGWAPYEFPEGSPRMGLLTQISFLAGHSHPGRSSATLRGKALREVLLCQVVPRPPANVDFSAVENPKPGMRTARDRVTFHLENPVCAGCHKITDPMGLALENFDGAGQYRESERGAVIDASGSLDGKSFTDVKGLAQAMHDHPAVPSCLVKRVYAYGTGSPTTPADRETLAYFDKKFAADGYRLRDLLRAVVLSSSFTTISEPNTPAPAKTASTSASNAPAGLQ
ncbi:MAG: DUF1592 domain-containing protein, partial [Alphaproteobacteria bacterium]